MRISGPHSHENLTIFLVHGADTLQAAKYLTLAEAIDQKKLVVHETGNVGELLIENVGDEDVYIQSGEIVKGGRQDRTLGTDMIVTRAMGKVPIPSFCVEQGRWKQRGSESAFAFSGGSKEMVAGKDMKLASNVRSGYGDQSKVWAAVAQHQQVLTANVGAPVASPASPSSFQLAMENKDLNNKLDGYIKDLCNTPDNRDDVIGWAYAVNGKISGANVYANHELFAKLWPKLLKSGAVEALAEFRAAQAAPAAQPTASEVEAFLSAAESRAPTTQPVNVRTSVATSSAESCVVIQTDDLAAGRWVHRNYLVTPPTEKPAR